MNSMLKEKLDFVIRVMDEHGYKIKILKDQEQPIEVETIISISAPKCIDDKNMLTFHKYIKNKEFRCIPLGENHNITEHYIKQFLGLETDCLICYSAIDESKVWCKKCRATICIKCFKQITQCPICQNKEWTIKHRGVLKVLSYDELNALFEDEYRKEYETFTGEDRRNTRYSTFTPKQQITRCSKFLAFWEIKLKELDAHPEFYSTDDYETHINKRMFFMDNIEQLNTRIDNTFSTKQIKKIREAANKLIVSATNNI